MTPQQSMPLPADAAGGDGKSGKTRERLLEATLDLVAEKGYQGTTLTDIASAAGITRAGLSHHFRSKEEVVMAALDHRNMRNARATHAINAQTPDELFTAIVKMMELNTWVPHLIRAYTILGGEAAAESHPVHDWFTGHYRSIRRAIADTLRSGARTGLIRSDADVEAVAAQLVALMNGLQGLWLHSPEDVDLPVVMAEAIARLRRDLAA